MSLRTEPRLSRHDEIFAALMEAHRDLDPEESRRLDAEIVLLLANHIGDAEVVMQAITLARSLHGEKSRKPEDAE
jgi:hypothetical protein